MTAKSDTFDPTVNRAAAAFQARRRSAFVSGGRDVGLRQAKLGGDVTGGEFASVR
jgi:hypothetical protein